MRARVTRISALGLAVFAALAAACATFAPGPALAGQPPAAPQTVDSSSWVDDDARKVLKPAPYEQKLYAHQFREGIVEPISRAFDVPARYVSGYRQSACGSCAPHGWAEAWVEDLGWVGFDPSAGISPDEHYVRVAVGVDASGAASIAGSRLGQGGEEMKVDLHVDQLGSDA